MSDDIIGREQAPTRYRRDGEREAIDLIRDSMSDPEFIAFCTGNAEKYNRRAGLKGPAEEDLDKAAWYLDMAAHVEGTGPDPREDRPDFQPYQRVGTPGPSLNRPKIPVLDHGFVRLVESWGGGDVRLPEAGIIEAARQSTQGAFRGWEDGDAKLLRYLYTHKHSTPFEFAGMTLEVRAPIFIFRQWHRHRTMSYNEASGRYRPLPDLYYLPTAEQVWERAQEQGGNAQAGSAAGSEPLSMASAERYVERLKRQCEAFRVEYRVAVKTGIPKEMARFGMPVSWYSQMRVTANLRNWLAFLTLRLDPHAQWEIRQYAQAVYTIVEHAFPQTAALFEREQG